VDGLAHPRAQGLRARVVGFGKGVVFQMWRYAARESPQTSVFTSVRPMSCAVISTFRTLPPSAESSSVGHTVRSTWTIVPSWMPPAVGPRQELRLGMLSRETVRFNADFLNPLALDTCWPPIRCCR
jgi:hypothetical protein